MATTAKLTIAAFHVFVLFSLTRSIHLVASEETDSSKTKQGNKEEPTCGMYLAASTLPNAGIGIFTGVPRAVGDILPSRDVCIPVMDMYWNHGYPIEPNPFKNYWWAGKIMGMALETQSEDVEALCFGLDCAINCHLPLINVGKAVPVYDDGNLHRSRDPGAGAFSPYHNGTTVATRDIPAGGELFKSYGDNWFTSRSYIFGKNYPLSENHVAAQRLLQLLGTAMGLKAAQDVAANLITFETGSGVDILMLSDLLNIVKHINKGTWESRTLSAFPYDLGKVRQVWQTGDIANVYQPAATRSIEELQQTGKCLDHISIGPSRLPQAGRGAFATRNLKAGTVLTASPLLHVTQESLMEMYNLTQNERGEWLRHVDTVVGYQVLLNYCFGHDESSLLLCPYGSGINYINHNQSLANVRVQWATNFDYMHQQHIVESGTIANDLNATKIPVLAFDYILTRDVTAGDELFLDYGTTWEKAWLDHVTHFVATANDESYISARRFNAIFSDAMIRTEDEQNIDSYPDHLPIHCHSKLTKRASLGLRPPRRHRFDWSESSEYGFPCRVIDRFYEEGEFWYTVEIEIITTKEDDSKRSQVDVITRTDVPRAAIRFFDKPGSTDLHLRNAFRHRIGIPDDMFPVLWRDRGD